MKTWMAMFVLLAAHPLAAADAPPIVRTMRVPSGGIQPQVVERGDVIHLIYFTGDPKAGDVNYARSTDGGHTFAKAIRVNSEPASAIAMGTIRGPRLAVGKDGRVHAAWMGSDRATPRAPGNAVPMLYARLNDAGDAFEPQRNVIAQHPGLDGGGTVAADEQGNVYVVWHAPEKPKDPDEGARAVWVARSADEGKTFAAELRVSGDGSGVCACCGLEAQAEPDGSGISVMYRTASERVHRDMLLVRYQFEPARRQATLLGRLNIGTCVMSTASIARAIDSTVAAWEGRGEVFYGKVDAAGIAPIPATPPGGGNNRKHPRLAVNAAQETLMVWTEDTAWNRGGTVAWQVLDQRLLPIPSATGRTDGLPAWDTAAAFPTRDGGFMIIY